MRGSIALVGSGEFLPIMADFEKSLIEDGIKNGKKSVCITSSLNDNTKTVPKYFSRFSLSAAPD